MQRVSPRPLWMFPPPVLFKERWQIFGEHVKCMYVSWRHHVRLSKQWSQNATDLRGAALMRRLFDDPRLPSGARWSTHTHLKSVWKGPVALFHTGWVTSHRRARRKNRDHSSLEAHSIFCQNLITVQSNFGISSLVHFGSQSPVILTVERVGLGVSTWEVLGRVDIFERGGQRTQRAILEATTNAFILNKLDPKHRRKCTEQ